MLKIMRAIIFGFFLYMTGFNEVVFSTTVSAEVLKTKTSCQEQEDIFFAILDECED
jgi:hypothetical protein